MDLAPLWPRPQPFTPQSSSIFWMADWHDWAHDLPVQNQGFRQCSVMPDHAISGGIWCQWTHIHLHPTPHRPMVLSLPSRTPLGSDGDCCAVIKLHSHVHCLYSFFACPVEVQGARLWHHSMLIFSIARRRKEMDRHDIRSVQIRKESWYWFPPDQSMWNGFYSTLVMISSILWTQLDWVHKRPLKTIASSPSFGPSQPQRTAFVLLSVPMLLSVADWARKRGKNYGFQCLSPSLWRSYVD